MIHITKDKKYKRLSSSTVEKHIQGMLSSLKKGGSGTKKSKDSKQ